ncbi:hypothetical protein [Bradyrhizobium sp. NP1]|uniref:hypothetical protein n=1 Tax=Bradyrhizobium sp. NP1 TaxID=3049772 RepID=UPI0025A5B483|nr:hypothetical protein [Bradyrhizobium sp. NP1]WJR76021.1 hypothetical protein QOU61_25035 [Bradyrhizobium sp. NP1]
MRQLVWLLGTALLSGCVASVGKYEPPVVDMTGVDQKRYAQDLNECTLKKEQASFVGSAQMISNCIEEHGYRVIEKRG